MSPLEPGGSTHFEAQVPACQPPTPRSQPPVSRPKQVVLGRDLVGRLTVHSMAMLMNAELIIFDAERQKSQESDAWSRFLPDVSGTVPAQAREYGFIRLPGRM